MAGCLKEKESARRSRWTQTLEKVNQGARPLEPLRVGDRVFVQNQVGSHARKWDRPGVGVEVRANDQYVVKLDGSGRTSLRNRRFLRRYTMPQSSLVGVPRSSSGQSEGYSLPQLPPGSRSRPKTAQDMSGLSGFSARFERFERFGRFGRFLWKNRSNRSNLA